MPWGTTGKTGPVGLSLGDHRTRCKEVLTALGTGITKLGDCAQPVLASQPSMSQVERDKLPPQKGTKDIQWLPLPSPLGVLT